MRRADRLFDIIQRLRAATGPVTAAMLATELEVTPRTVYRDIATLQARRVPIEGAAGIGYLLRRGFDLPPLMFTAEEIDAIAVGVRLLRRVRDPRLHAAADRVLAKVAGALSEDTRPSITAPPLYVSDGDAATPTGVDLSAVRDAIRAARKMRIAYADERGRRTRRTIWPVAIAYYVDATVLGAWCELRHDFRHFRVERIASSRTLDERFPASDALLADWMALSKDRAAPAPHAAGA